jgi:hypothetical protein
LDQSSRDHSERNPPFITRSVRLHRTRI